MVFFFFSFSQCLLFCYGHDCVILRTPSINLVSRINVPTGLYKVAVVQMSLAANRNRYYFAHV